MTTVRRHMRNTYNDTAHCCCPCLDAPISNKIDNRCRERSTIYRYILLPRKYYLLYFLHQRKFIYVSILYEWLDLFVFPK